MTSRTDTDFSKRLLAWYAAHGRTDLPWQSCPTPYRVWISEIMLQQTRVATVIPYYERFMTQFPDVATLAGADLDSVLHHWSGLGYYARARHLHAAARIIMEVHGGKFPEEFAAVIRLPGIGRSTAGAILSLAAGQRHPILDGNVKRVLTRFHALTGWPGQTAAQNRLWELAGKATPRHRVAAYTQAIMDLGATVCTRAQPSCACCPLHSDCAARAAGRQGEFPTPRARKRLPVRQTRMLILHNPDGEVLLEQRPPTGIWGGLWSFPECSPDASVAEWCHGELGITASVTAEWPVFRHTFSHYHLDISPVLARATAINAAVMEADKRLWYNHKTLPAKGFATPVSKLLARLNTQRTGLRDDKNSAVRQAG
ncbi:MAG: A/G-specific adenine glycosylase [Thiohalobacterales bacterium]